MFSPSLPHSYCLIIKYIVGANSLIESAMLFGHRQERECRKASRDESKKCSISSALSFPQGFSLFGPSFTGSPSAVVLENSVWGPLCYCSHRYWVEEKTVVPPPESSKKGKARVFPVHLKKATHTLFLSGAR